jgi:uncharacterized surface protein with fasciclin (FAS1) repeats
MECCYGKVIVPARELRRSASHVRERHRRGCRHRGDCLRGRLVSELLTAAEAAGLVDTLKSEGPFTVFAPTDEAFAKLPEGTVESLLKPENQEQLKAILTYHVVPGKTMSSELAGKQVEVESVEGSAISIDATGDSVMVDDATVTQADIEADNGVIHVIDAVIQPQA